MSTRNEKRLFHLVREASLRYRMLENGDRIAVGVSGGKDSLTLLYAFHLLKRYTPLQFEVVGLTLDLGYNQDFSAVADYCRELNIDYQVIPTNIGRAAFAGPDAHNPCALCAHLRRGSLNRQATALGCNKVALAHHLDDAVATLMMSAFYNSRFQVYTPVTYLDRADLTVIRPLIYCEQELMYKMVQQLSLPVVVNPCPANGNTKRTEVENWMRQTEQVFPHARIRLLRAWENLNPNSFWFQGEQVFD
ncbi:MAG: tRNA 2-thiocytidine biosynthesis TtcA family protein [Methylocystaceae bacterium]